MIVRLIASIMFAIRVVPPLLAAAELVLIPTGSSNRLESQGELT